MGGGIGSGDGFGDGQVCPLWTSVPLGQVLNGEATAEVHDDSERVAGTASRVDRRSFIPTFIVLVFLSLVE